MLNKLSFFMMTALFLSACGGSGGWQQTKSNGAKIVIEGISINWGVAPGIGKGPNGEDLALFSFTKFNGNSTTSAGLTVDERAELGKKALAAHPSCTWTRFDPALSAAKSYQLGAVDSIIVAPVSC